MIQEQTPYGAIAYTLEWQALREHVAEIDKQ